MDKRLIAALLIALLAIGGGGWWLRSRPPPPLEPVGPVRIGASLTLSPALIWIARDRGMFADAGLEATIQDYSSGKTTTEAMLRGEVDISASAEFLAVRKSFQHKDLRILGTTAFVHQIKLLGLRERGIASVEDFRGKRVGVRLGTNGEYFLARLLTLHGMAREEIQWVDLPPQEMSGALAAGSVDGVLIWPPFTQRIQEELGERVVAFDGQPGQDYYYLLLSRREWLEGHPLVAQRVVLALKKAEEWTANHPGEAQSYLAQTFGLRPEVVGETLQEYRFSVSLPQALLTAMEAETRWLRESGGVPGTRVENFLDMIDFRPLLAVAPQAVTIVR